MSAHLAGYSIAFAAGEGTSATQQQAGEPGESAKKSIAELLDGATLIGDGLVKMYEMQGKTLVTLKPNVFGKLFHWYAEAVQQPAQITSKGGNAVGDTTMRLERRGNKVFMRDLVSEFARRSATGPGSESPAGAPKLNPIDLSLAETGLGTIVAGFDILAEGEDGTILLDLTAAFSTDFGGVVSARKYLARAGAAFVAVDPKRSYIERATSFDASVIIRSHLTLVNPAGESVSIVVGHSLSLLPENKMPAREFDNRVGFFKTSFAEYGGAKAVEDRSMILRHRLERPADAPDGLVDPVEPIVYYIGRDIPDRWRPYIKAGVESWQTAFEEAGYSNAIVARDAPSIQEDPNWSPEDTDINVIRWVAQPFANAMGPVTYDPRTGEILGAHILLWPQVLDYFTAYYFSLHSSVDPGAASYPLSEAKSGDLLAYIVTHEVGHTLGLRHNHLASTAFTTAELRDPEFANANGPNASIMAYGRFNQAAQPGDGVTTFLPVIGSYDKFAIKWGYAPLDSLLENEISETLDKWAREASQDRLRRWAAAEMPSELRGKYDPRVQMENTGADRVEATRLGIMRLSATMASLPESTGQDVDYTRQIFGRTMAVHGTFLKSVISLVGGVTEDPSGSVRYEFIPRTEQQEAVSYLLGEGSQSLDIYADHALLRNLEPAGGLRRIDAVRETLMHDLMDGSRLALLEMQARLEDGAYNVPAFANDIVQAVFGTLKAPSHGQQTLQVAFLDNAERIMKTPASRRQMDSIGVSIPGLSSPGLVQTLSATGGGTAFPGWVRKTFPSLADRLETAARSAGDERVALHYQSLATRMREIARLPIVQKDDAQE